VGLAVTISETRCGRAKFYHLINTEACNIFSGVIWGSLG